MALFRCTVVAAAAYVSPVLAARKVQLDSAAHTFAVEGEDKDFEVADYQLKVKGKSGKFEFFNKVKGEGKSGVEIEMDAIREVDAAGKVIGNSGPVKHSLNTFASQDFKIEKTPASGVVDGVDSMGVHFESTIPNVGTVAVETFIIKQDGEMGPPNEKWQVHKGDLKWNIFLKDWDFCEAAKNNCKSKDAKEGDGAFVELDIKVKKKSGKKMKVKKGKKALQEAEDAEEKETLELSNQVEVDGEWQSMPEGYPMMTTKGKATVFTFRFPKFTSTIFYDPLLSESGETSTKSAAPRAAAWGTLLLLAAGLAGRQ